MFEELLVNLLILVLSLLVLTKASHLTITNAVKSADAVGIGKTTIGFILLAFSTSMPELLVSIFSALEGNIIGLAIGNVLGSNIVNVCLILGTCIIIATFSKTRRNCIDFTSCVAEEEIGSLYFGLFMASIIPLILIYIKEASRYVGAILLALFIFNAYFMTKKRTSIYEEVSEKEKRKIFRYVLFLIIGIVGVIGSSYFLVDSAANIALTLGVPSVVIGATVVAFGTSVPELATSIEASRLGHLDMALGNIVGSGFINLTIILGATLVSSPFTVNIAAFSELAIFSLIANLFLWYFISSNKTSIKEGVILVGLYALYLTTSFGGYKP
ncbi:sodium:calcium antiporter [Candidatus Bathyarchaeota archaeon]|nr:sodium:calcium antiporter [Candidatus Bathyarchaeota archaeon]MBS7631901.1 sodium:calcium antiporter [Candidatus Bathyarchaeota archaeon]